MDIYYKFPVFKFNNFYLREISPARDAECFLEYINHQAVASFLAASDVPSDINTAILELNYWSNLFKQKRSIYWAIAELDSDQIIGTVGFNQYNTMHKRAEISYDLNYNFWGQGIMLQALTRILEYAFNQMSVIRVQGTVACHNQRSIKLLEKLQFRQEGMMAKFCILNNQAIDYFMYGLIKEYNT